MPYNETNNGVGFGVSVVSESDFKRLWNTFSRLLQLTGSMTVRFLIAVLLHIYYYVSRNSHIEIILKIGQNSATLRARVGGVLFDCQWLIMAPAVVHHRPFSLLLLLLLL